MDYTLNTVCDFIPGNSWKSELFSNSGIPIIRINNLNENNNEFVYWPEKDYDSKYLTFHGDILVSLSGTIKIYKWKGSEGLLNQRIVNIKLKNKYINIINEDWLFYKIKSSLNLIEQRGKKSTIKNISVSELKEIKLINLPSIEEQNRIVTILDKVEVLIKKRDKVLFQMDQLINSVFFDTFGDIFSPSNKLKKFPLKKIINNIQSGTSYNADETNLEIGENELGVLKANSVSKGIFDASQYKTFEKNKATKKNIFPQKGDLLINRANTIDLVATSCIVDKDYPNLVLSDKIWKITTEESIVKKSYLHFVLNSKNYKQNIRRVATGSTGSMLNISMDKFKQLIIPVPEYTLQVLFDTKYFLTQEKKQKLLQSKLFLETLLKSLTQRIFSGQSLADINTELETIINSINLDLPDSQNNIDNIVKDVAYRQKLLDKLATQDFSDISQYDKAKHIAFRLLKDKINQEFDLNKKKIILT